MTEKEYKEEPIVWRAAEFERRERSVLWYVVMAGIAIVLTIIALFQNNFFFALFILLAAGMLVFWSRRKPRIVEFRIDDEGISVASAQHAYESLDHFWVRERPGRLDEIVVKRKAVLNPLLKIAVDQKTGEAARKKLLEKLPEMGEDQESLLDILSDWLGF